jgi:hypothetical protein
LINVQPGAARLALSSVEKIFVLIPLYVRLNSSFVQNSIFDPIYGLLLWSQEVTKIDIITLQEQKTQ